MLDIRIAKPCNQTWTAMKGDAQVRHCGACRKNVYNISEMTQKEVEALIIRTEGHFCARIYRRTDGRVLTADCPKGVAAVRRKRTLAVTGAFAAFAGVLNAVPVMGGTASRSTMRKERVELPKSPIDSTTGIAARPIDRDREATIGKVKVVAPSMELGEVTVPTPSRKGTYQVERGERDVAPNEVVEDRKPGGADDR